MEGSVATSLRCRKFDVELEGSPGRPQLEEAAAVLSVSPRTVRRRISAGTIPTDTIGRRGTIRVRLDELEVAMRAVPSAILRPVRSGRRWSCGQTTGGHMLDTGSVQQRLGRRVFPQVSRQLYWWRYWV